MRRFSSRLYGRTVRLNRLTSMLLGVAAPASSRSPRVFIERMTRKEGH
jgi:hypothetical protein